MDKRKQPQSKEHRIKIGLANSGKVFTDEHKNKLRLAHLGKKTSEETKEKHRQHKHSAETRRKQAESHLGHKSHLWKGGLTKKNKKIRNSIEFRLWREAVFARDNWTCKECGDDRGGNLESHHIKSFSLFPELRFAIDNGMTLCRDCHKKTDNYARGFKNVIVNN